MWESTSIQYYHPPTSSSSTTSELHTRSNVESINSTTTGFQPSTEQEKSFISHQKHVPTAFPTEASSTSPFSYSVFTSDRPEILLQVDKGKIDYIDNFHPFYNLSEDAFSTSDFEIVTVSLDGLYNESLWTNNGSISYDEEGSPDEGHYNWGVLSLTILIIATMVGNVLVCLAVCWEKRLQNMTNYFLMSLAIADLLVSMLVMPLGMVVELFGYFPLNAGVCVMWATFDVLMCTASIWHMCTMSMDRYFTLKYPMKYGRNKTRTMVALKILFVWVISISISCPVCILGFLDYTNVFNAHSGACVPVIRSFIVYGSLFAFYIPLCIMILTYVLTIKILCDNQKLMKSIAKQQGDSRGKKDKDGAYPMSYLSPNVYVPRYMDRGSIDTTVSGITINETSLINDNLSSTKDEELSLDPPLVPEPSPEWSKHKTQAMDGGQQQVWANRNGQPKTPTLTFEAVNWQVNNEKTGTQSGNDLKVNLSNVPCSSTGLFGQTNSAFCNALDPDCTGVPSDEDQNPSLSVQMGYFPNNLPDPLYHISSPAADLMLSSSQPHLPSALSPPLSSVRMRSRLTSAPSCGIRLNNELVENLSQTNVNNSTGYLACIPTSPNGNGAVFDGLSASPGSSYGSVHSRTNWGSSTALADLENPDLLEKLSMIEQEMDECIRQGPCVIDGVPQEMVGFEKPGEEAESTNEGADNEYEEAVGEEEVEGEEEEDGGDSDDGENGDPAAECLCKQVSEDRDSLRLNLPPSVLVSSPPNISSDDTANDSDSEKSNLITIHLKASGCYLYQIDPVISGFANSRNRVGEATKPTAIETKRAMSALGRSDFSADESEREGGTHEMYYMNDTEESCSESGNAKMLVHRVYPVKKKKKLNSHIRSYASGWRALMKRKKKDIMPVCKVNGVTPVTIISKRTASNEKKASKVLGIIFGVFVVLWTPFFMMNIVSVVCEKCMDAVTPAMMACIVWFGYMSSLANPIIYTMFNTAFRKTFYRILTCKYPRKHPAHPHDNMMPMTTATLWGSDRRNTLTITLKE